MSCRGCQARMGIIVVPYAAAGSRTFALDSRASCPTCTTVPRAIQLASIPGEEVSSPGPPPLRPCQTKRHSLATRARREVERVSVRDSTTTPIVGVPPGGAHSSSRLAPMRFTQSSR